MHCWLPTAALDMIPHLDILYTVSEKSARFLEILSCWRLRAISSLQPPPIPTRDGYLLYARVSAAHDIIVMHAIERENWQHLTTQSWGLAYHLFSNTVCTEEDDSNRSSTRRNTGKKFKIIRKLCTIQLHIAWNGFEDAKNYSRMFQL